MKTEFNTTGVYRVCPQKNKNTYQGFIWVYQLYEGNYKQSTISSAKLSELEKKVKEKGLKWEIIDEEKYQKSLAKEKDTISTRNTSGIKRVRIVERKNGYSFIYEKKKRKKEDSIRILKHTIEELEKEVKERGLEWTIIDEEKYQTMKQKTNND